MTRRPRAGSWASTGDGGDRLLKRACRRPGVLLWVGVTLAFRFYVANPARYDSIYGSPSAVIVLQLWLMLSAFILLFGARLNAEVMRAAGALEE